MPTPQALAFYPTPNHQWLRRWQEPALEPTLPIIDAHHHLWDRPGWRYVFEDLQEDLGSGHAVQATVYLQCRAWYRDEGPEALRPVGETDYVESVAAASASGRSGTARACAAIVSYADLTLGAAVDEVLEAHRAASPTRFRGIRHGGATDPDPAFAQQGHNSPLGLFRQTAFREGFARLAAYGLSFDAWLYHPQLDDLIDLAKAFPATPIVLNHVGGPLGIGPYAGRRDEILAQWRSSIRRLCDCPNVVVKLGGLGMRSYGFGFHEAPEPPTSLQLAAAWRPYVETCIEAFGADRCMFESNFPVDKASCSYGVLWNAFKRLAAGCSDSQKAELFAGTAMRVYRIDPKAISDVR